MKHNYSITAFIFLRCFLIHIVTISLYLTIGTVSIMAEMTVTNLRCEYLINPLGVETQKPRLSWTLESSERSQIQTAYQILVASGLGKLEINQADLWDSGKVQSNESINIVYSGKTLDSCQRAFWKIRAWDKENEPSLYSESAWWEMALINANDWKAKWIVDPKPLPTDEPDHYKEIPAPLFRKEFTLKKNIESARAYITGVGYYEFYLNGAKVGDHVLDPAWTAYAKRVLYSVYDVTDLLKNGSNAAGILVGNGWYNPLPMRMWGKFNIREHLTIGKPRAILQININYTDGTHETITTDKTWKTAASPILKNNIYLGELYDARKEQTGWNNVNYDDTEWVPVAISEDPIGPLNSQSLEPIKITKTINPIAITEPKPGVYIVDMGQNFAGWITLKVNGDVGTKVTMRYGELLYPDGTLNFMTSVCGQIKNGRVKNAPHTAFQSDTYILKGGGEEAYTPRFTFHGFRYVELTGFPGKPDLNTIAGLRLNSSVQPVGEFSCSNEMFNRIQTMTEWTQLSNMFGLQSDCPHRERFGYGGDIVASSEMAIFNFNMAPFYIKAVQDLADSVRSNGGFTECAPYVGIADEGLGDNSGPVGWGTAFPLLQWQLYQYYGNKRLLEEQYDVTKKWLTLLELSAKDYILDNGLSDHESLVPKPRALTGTALYYYNIVFGSKIAGAIGHPDDADYYRALADKIKSAFIRQYYDPRSGKYDTGTQACQSFALYMDLIESENHEAILAALIDDIEQIHNGHISTGIFGTKFMLLALSEYNRADIAYEIVNQKDFPGWGYMLKNGATTLWEHWKFSDNTYSHNHPMFGSVSEWFYKALAGICSAPDAVGFDKIIIKPNIVGDLTWAKGNYNSIRGPINSEWRLDGHILELRVSIPCNTEAIVYIPTSNPDTVRESGKPISNDSSLTFLRVEAAGAVYKIGSGDYHFSTQYQYD